MASPEHSSHEDDVESRLIQRKYAEHDSQVLIKGNDNWLEQFCCCFWGCVFCLPCCPLFNYCRYRQLENEQKKAVETGQQEFKIDRNYEQIAKWSLYFAVFLMIWFLVGGIICLTDNTCTFIATSSDS
jgi:hypothetical protein